MSGVPSAVACVLHTPPWVDREGMRQRAFIQSRPPLFRKAGAMHGAPSTLILGSQLLHAGARPRSRMSRPRMDQARGLPGRQGWVRTPRDQAQCSPDIGVPASAPDPPRTGRYVRRIPSHARDSARFPPAGCTDSRRVRSRLPSPIVSRNTGAPLDEGSGSVRQRIHHRY
jgi:hypothetical protein